MVGPTSPAGEQSIVSVSGSVAKMIRRTLTRTRNRLFLIKRYPKRDEFFSQYGQDMFIVEQLFRGMRGGFFVDIGASDGITLSNTYYLERNLGWTGICFEPNPAAYEKLRQNRKCLCINGAVSNQKGQGRLLRIDGYSEMLSGLLDKYDPMHLVRIEKELREHGGKREEIMVRCYDLNEVLADNGVTHVDYLSIDTEGSEFDILKSVDFEQATYKTISVEDNYGDDRIEKHLKAKRFKLVAIIGTDEIYVRRPP